MCEGVTELTKEKLGQLISLRAEIRDIERKIKGLENVESPKSKDIVKSSGHEWPYIEGHTVIEGYDEAADIKKDRQLERLGVARRNRIARAQQTEAEIEEFIAGINDSRIRLMIQYYYVDGYTYEKVGELMHCDRTTVERTIDRYLKNN
jgi:DNA-directed RNA polymerase specialized sigma24 family protein